MDYAFAPPEPTSLPIAGSELRFPVHRIFCIGKNYAEHAREMGSDPKSEPPCFFSKPLNALVPGDRPVPYPSATQNLHHEIELVVALARGGRNIATATATGHIYGYAAGVDLTRRDLQAEAKSRGWPWETAKGFEASAPCSPVTRAAEIGHPTRARLWLSVNDELRQDADIADMTWSVAEVIAELSQLFELQAGDLIFTGTPAGVGELKPGDRVRGGVDGVGELDFEIT